MPALLDTIHHHEHVRFGIGERGTYTPATVAEIRDRTEGVVARQDPIDHTRPLAHYHLGIDESGPMLLPLRAEGVADPLRFSKTGLRQWADRVLPSRGLSFLDELVNQGESGRKLAELNAAVFSRQSTDASLVRTAVLDEEARAVRCVASSRYAVVDDLDIVRVLLDEPRTANLPVLAYRRDDTGSMLRIALDASVDLQPGNEHHVEERVFPAIEVGNSEVGLGAVWMRAGAFRLTCTNGIWSWGDDAINVRWIHAGGRSGGDRIRQGIGDAVESARTVASGTIGKYAAALDTAIDDVWGFMQHALRRDLGKGVIAAARVALEDPTTPRAPTLAQAINAVTLAAQAVPVMDQRVIETAGGRLLDYGLRAAGPGGIHVCRDDEGKVVKLEAVA
jgi:hypothetical protein